MTKKETSYEKAEQHNAIESARLKANLPQIEDLKQEQKARDNFWCRELKKWIRSWKKLIKRI